MRQCRETEILGDEFVSGALRGDADAQIEAFHRSEDKIPKRTSPTTMEAIENDALRYEIRRLLRLRFTNAANSKRTLADKIAQDTIHRAIFGSEEESREALRAIRHIVRASPALVGYRSAEFGL